MYPRGAYIGAAYFISEADLYPGGIIIIGCILFVGRRAYNWVASKWGVEEFISGSLRCGSHFT